MQIGSMRIISLELSYIKTAQLNEIRQKKKE